MNLTTRAIVTLSVFFYFHLFMKLFVCFKSIGLRYKSVDEITPFWEDDSGSEDAGADNGDGDQSDVKTHVPTATAAPLGSRGIGANAGTHLRQSSTGSVGGWTQDPDGTSQQLLFSSRLLSSFTTTCCCWSTFEVEVSTECILQ